MIKITAAFCAKPKAILAAKHLARQLQKQIRKGNFRNINGIILSDNIFIIVVFERMDYCMLKLIRIITVKLIKTSVAYDCECESYGEFQRNNPCAIE